MAKAVGVIAGVALGVFFAPAGLAVLGAVAGGALGYAAGSAVDQMLNPGFDIPDIANNVESQTAAGININKIGTDNYIPVIYGERHIGGTRVHITTDSANNQYLYVKTVLCEGPILRIEKFYLDDTFVIGYFGASIGYAFDSAATKYQPYQAKNKDNQTITVTPVQIDAMVGYSNQAAVFRHWGPGWTADHKLSGLAHTSALYQNFPPNNPDDASKNPFNGIPNAVCLVSGKLILRLENLTFWENTTGATYYSTNGKSGYDTGFFTSPTLQYDRNPVNCLYDYLTNNIYGKGLSRDQIDLFSFKTEATRWYKDSAGNTVSADLQHHCNAVIDTSRTIFENVENMLFNMNATLPYINGKYTLVVEDNRNTDGRYGGTATSIMTVNENNIIGGITIESENVAGKYNRVVVSYPGGEMNEMVEVYYPVPGSTEEAGYLAEDNGRINELRLSYEQITSATVATQKAKFALMKSRYRGKTISFTGDASLHQVTIGNIITITYSPLNINAQYRVKTIQYNPDYTFNIVAEEHNDTLYNTPVAAATPKEIYRTYSSNAQPIYIKNSTPAVVYVGDFNQSLEQQPMSQVLAELPTEWQTYVNDNFNVANLSLTATQIEAGLNDGTITRWLNADLVIPTSDIYTKPEIIGSEVIYNADTSIGNADIRITMKKNFNANITDTNLLIFDYHQQQYKTYFVPESDTAAARGEITLKNYPLGIPIKYIIQYKSATNKISSDVYTINQVGYYEDNKIQAEFLDTPLYTLDNQIQWDDPAADSSELQWSETGTWTTGTTDETHTTLIYETASVDMGLKIDAYPETTVFYKNLGDGSTPGNLKITYLISEDDITFYEIPYNLIPVVRYEYFYAISETADPVTGLFFEVIQTMTGPARYYKTKITLQQGEFYGVLTKWNTKTFRKTLSNYNMYSTLWIEDEATYPNCDSARLYSRPTGSTETQWTLDPANSANTLLQEYVSVGGTPDLGAISLFAGNVVGGIVPNNNFKFGKLISAVGITALQQAGDITPIVEISANAFALTYPVGGGNIYLTFTSTAYGNFYYPVLPYTVYDEATDTGQPIYNWSVGLGTKVDDGSSIRLNISSTDQDIIFTDIASNTVIYTGPLKMNWDFVGYPQLIFNETAGTIRTAEQV